MLPEHDPFKQLQLEEQLANQDWFLDNYKRLLNRQQLVDTGALEDEINRLVEQIMAQQALIEHLEEVAESDGATIMTNKHTIDTLNKQKVLVQKALELADMDELNGALDRLSQDITAQERTLVLREGCLRSTKNKISAAKKSITNLNKQKNKLIKALEAAPTKNAKITKGAKKLLKDKDKYVRSRKMKQTRATTKLAKKLAKALGKMPKDLFAQLPDSPITDYASKDQLTALNNYLASIQPLLPQFEDKYRRTSDLARDQLADIYAFHRRNDPVPSDSSDSD
tara:strand:- start:603 stop:1448 length:846 start_codon:yes stop_codon:yes gene_type:complete